MHIETIGIIGGGGFVGRHLSNALVESGYKLRALVRSRERARSLWLLPDTDVVELDLYDESALAAHLAGCDAVINLVGIRNEKGDNGNGFRRAHTELTRTILKACADVGVKRYLHMSALNAEPFGPSYYLRTKGEAENAALAAHDDGLPTTVFRPSVIFGPDDSFLNQFATLLRYTPIAFPLACADAKLQPVYIGDVCRAFVSCLDNRASFGKRYDLGGPEIKTLAELVEYIMSLTGTKRIILPLGRRLSKLQANVFEYVPGKPFSRDNFRSLSEDSVCTNGNGLVDLGIKPTSLGEVVPSYLGGKFERMRYYGMRASAQRP